MAPGSNSLKVSPTTFTIKELGKPIVTVRNSDISKFQQTPLRVYADQRGTRSCKKPVEEQIQSHNKQFTRELKDDKTMKHGKRDPSSGFSSSRSNISRAMRVGIPKISDFLAIRNQNNKIQTELAHELALPTQSAPPSD